MNIFINICTYSNHCANHPTQRITATTIHWKKIRLTVLQTDSSTGLLQDC